MRAFRRILDCGNRASICGVIGRMKFVTSSPSENNSCSSHPSSHTIFGSGGQFIILS